MRWPPLMIELCVWAARELRCAKQLFAGPMTFPQFQRTGK